MKRLDFLVEALLNEAIKLDSADALFNAIKNKQIGVKLQPEFFQIVDKCKPEITILYNKLSSEVKNIQFPVGFLLKQISTQSQLRTAVTKAMDGIIEFAKNYNKPWVKELKSYKALENSTMFNSDVWHNLEKEIQDEAPKHGKASKGSGNFKGDTKPIYSDSTWELYKVSTFEQEKAIAFYGKNWDKPTHWCTRAQKHWFDNYTKNYGEKYLWIFRNVDGHTWQMAFDSNHIEFMDEDDNRPNSDGIKTFLKSLPDELCKKVTPNKGYTLYDIKSDKKQVTDNKEHQVVIKLKNGWNNSCSISGAETPTNWKDIKTTNTKKINFPEGKNIFKNSFEISDIADYVINYNNDDEKDALERGARSAGNYITKIIHAKKLDDSDHYEIALFKNQKEANILKTHIEDLVITSPKVNYNKTVCYMYDDLAQDLHYDRARKRQEPYKELPPQPGAASSLLPTTATIKKEMLKNPKCKELIAQLPFGEFKSITKFTTLSNAKAPIVSFDDSESKNTPFGGYFNLDTSKNYRIKGVFPKKILVSFKNGNCYFQSGKMIFEPATEETEEKEFDLNSKEAKAVKEIYKIWLKARFEYTKPMYNQYKTKLANQQLDSDHEAWKKGETRLRPLGRVYEELNEETSYFNY